MDNNEHKSSFFSNLIVVVGFLLACFGIYQDYIRGNDGWATLDFFCPPLGALRGLMYLLDFMG